MPDKVTFDLPGVCAYVNDSVGASTKIHGILSVIEKQYGNYIEWSPLENLSPIQDELSEWIVPESTNTPKDNDPTKNFQSSLKRSKISLDIKDLRSFILKDNEDSDLESTMQLVANDGTSYSILHFTMGGCQDFITILQKYCTLKRSAKENNLILVTDEKTEALQQSVTMLFKDNSQDFLTRFWNNPVNATVTGLGRLTNLLQDHVLPVILDMNADDVDDQRNIMKTLMELKKADDEADDLRVHNSDGFEYITQLNLPDRPDIARDQPMTKEEWSKHLNADGSVNDVRDLKLKIFRGGLSAETRQAVWKFLLNVYDWKSTQAERDLIRAEKQDYYYRMKLQWKTISEDQQSRFAEFSARTALIEKDVARTDRNHKFFEGDHNSNLLALRDVLMTYLMYNFDLGYVQGMSDLLSPIMVVMENEVDSFWAFVGFMDKVHKNFAMDQKDIKNQLMQLRDLLMVVNPTLANYLESNESDNMYFCFRWILVLFKREFNFSEIMRLWEVLWTDMPCKNFHLLICIAILEQQKDMIIENKFGFTEVLKHINDLSMRLNLDEILRIAEGIYHQLAATQDKLFPHVCQHLGFQVHRKPTVAIVSSPSSSDAPSSGNPDTAPVSTGLLTHKGAPASVSVRPKRPPSPRLVSAPVPAGGYPGGARRIDDLSSSPPDQPGEENNRSGSSIELL